MATFDNIKQFRQCWQVPTSQGNLISDAFQGKLIIFPLLLAALVIEQTYTCVMGFYFADNTQNIPQTWSILLIKKHFFVIKQTVFKLALCQSKNQQHFARDCTLPAGVEHCAYFGQAAMLFTILHF